ncbi:allantoicase [Segniliparus rugosus]|uniref:Probable allantoicase n=1 Tax=Segniliparus rugosus (strain ATCC BAA-974 / DSM 45345 / CCUG 50838 / CIP 108380 / JCM 13579 / CDC 945) TaxID=679197 RepID=E5XRK6_SEGRC|nr:allantoicase [Segniliparus rugosus]EFV13024.1 allantoicase [Segniliparus rugosus ATCC BAA-974]
MNGPRPEAEAGPQDFAELPDLASRALGGAVIWANDEFFAEKENLIKPGAPAFTPADFGHKGQVYDGWETRRRRAAGSDQAIVRLGVPGRVHGVVVDTAWFKGNAPTHASVEALFLPGHPDSDEVRQSERWETLVPKSPLVPDFPNALPVPEENRGERRTHLRLTIHPDGGVARFRAHGFATPDPAFLRGDNIDLAASENGGRVVDCSNRFYSHPHQLLGPGKARVMGDGWETARRRDSGNDWVLVRLAEEGVADWAEIDTSYFLGNAPGAASLTGLTASGEQVPLLGRTKLAPDTRHRFRLAEGGAPITHVRLDIFPDGGLARFRLWGSFTPKGFAGLEKAWGKDG